MVVDARSTPSGFHPGLGGVDSAFVFLFVDDIELFSSELRCERVRCICKVDSDDIGNPAVFFIWVKCGADHGFLFRMC